MLRALSIEDMEKIREWRNKNIAILRTPYLLTKEQQEQWYKDEICNRNSRSRFWAISENELLIGYGGIEKIEWENRIGEISLLIDPKKTGMGHGKKAAIEILNKAFDELNLTRVYAECYHNNNSIIFWRKISKLYYTEEAFLPGRKYWGGIYYDSTVFSMCKKL